MSISSTEPSYAGRIAAGVGARAMDVAMQKGIEQGVRAAIEYIDGEKKRKRKGRQDRRLRNTKLLLRNYQSLKSHVIGAVFSARQARESAVDILDGLDESDLSDELYIESVKKSQQRTLIILSHIEEMLKYFRIAAEQSGRVEDLRGYRVIMAYYIDEDKLSIEQIAQREHIERRTVYKDINIAAQQLSALIFGIDSLRMM